ncbi:MAG: glycosyltransferase [Planctomycetes bacterium]|nr:glycosyltransferase [Planctomycetota bacterium]
MVLPGRGDPAPKLTVLIPMLNESGNIPALFGRLWKVLDELAVTSEVVVVDDGSTDDTLALLLAEQQRRPALRVVSFARNFGQHAAVLAGFERSRGEFIVTLDADLQNPPEEIPRLVEAFEAGHDLVNTHRRGRQDTAFRKTASRLVNWFVRKASGIQLDDFGCMLRGYHRDVARPMTEHGEFHTFIPALAMLYARNPVEIPVGHASRGSGRSKYSLFKLFSLQLDLVASFSLTPLRLLFSMGFVIAAAGILFGITLLVGRLFFGAEWAAGGVFTLFAILFIFVGAQFVAFGLLGEYIGRIFQEVRHRPIYLVRDVHEVREVPPDEPPVSGDSRPVARNRLEEHAP